MEQVRQYDEEEIIQIDEDHETPLSIHGINKKISSQNTSPTGGSFSLTFGSSTETRNGPFSAAFSGPIGNSFGTSTETRSSPFNAKFGGSIGNSFGSFGTPPIVRNAPFSFQMCGDMKYPGQQTEQKVDTNVIRHPETGLPIKQTPFQFGFPSDRKQNIDVLYNELNNMRSKMENCNKTLDIMYYSNELMTEEVHNEYNNLREYYNCITKSIDKIYETLRFIN